MTFTPPDYTPPDFSKPPVSEAPVARFVEAPADGVAPEGYHATSVFPEYFQLRTGTWIILRESRMDCVAVLRANDELEVTEFRRLKKGDMVAVGRGEDGEDGIYVHTEAFAVAQESDKFAFRTRASRETSFSIDYDELYELLPYEREHGFILWVMGPAVVFDRDARNAFVSLVQRGYVNALFAGNALATHDVEGALYHTGLGQDIYTKKSIPLGHYHHLDTLNTIRSVGSLKQAVAAGTVKDGIIRALIGANIPFVLAGSIRDDGPMPEVVANAYEAQDRMRAHARKATTVIALATQLHSIATGNMTPSYQVTKDGGARPVYFFCVDMSEFAVNKLADRGSLTARSILTNAQDFMVTLERGLRP